MNFRFFKAVGNNETSAVKIVFQLQLFLSCFHSQAVVAIIYLLFNKN